MASLETILDYSDEDELKTIPADLSKLSNVKDKFVKKTVYNKMIIKVNAIGTKTPSITGFVSKTHNDSDRQGLENKIEDVDKKILNNSWQVKKADYYTKITETKNKIPNFTGLVTAAALNAKATEIGSKILDTSTLVKKTMFVIKENTTRVVATHQNNVLLLWHAILNCIS